MSKSRLFALLGSALNTVITIILIVQLLPMFNSAYAANFISVPNKKFHQTFPVLYAYALTGVLIFFGLLICFLRWFSFSKLDKGNSRSWKTLLLILGLLSIFPGTIVTIFGNFVSNGFFTFFINPIIGLFFILAFSLKSKGEISKVKVVKEKFEPFSHPALPEKQPDDTKVYVKNKFLVVIQLAIIVYLEIIPQILMKYFEHINNKSQTSFSILQDFLVILLILLMIVIVIFWGKKVTKIQLNLSILKKNLRILFLGILVLFVTSFIGNILSTLLGQRGLSSNERNLQLLQKNMPLFLMIILASILGPIVEETVFRVGFFELLFKDHPFLAWFIGASIFGFLHVGGIFQSLNLSAFPPYFFAGIVLGWLYWKTRRVEVSATVHGTWNLIGTLLHALALM